MAQLSICTRIATTMLYIMSSNRQCHNDDHSSYAKFYYNYIYSLVLVDVIYNWQLLGSYCFFGCHPTI